MKSCHWRESITNSPAFTVCLTFTGDLVFFLKSSAPEFTIHRTLKERSSVKDIIESCGVPHPEVDRIRVDGTSVDFTHVVDKNSLIDVYPVDVTTANREEHHLQRRGLTTFVADGHLGKLTRNLRLLGFDVAYANPVEDRQLLATMERENRALLTRDRRLLMHSVVRDGFYPRSQDGTEQTLEVIRRFDVSSLIAPFSRCLRCNGFLCKVDKTDVIGDLEPLTRIYYEQFRRCTECGQIYWPGSHFDKLRARVEGFRAKLAL